MEPISKTSSVIQTNIGQTENIWMTQTSNTI